MSVVAVLPAPAYVSDDTALAFAAYRTPINSGPVVPARVYGMKLAGIYLLTLLPPTNVVYEQ